MYTFIKYIKCKNTYKKTHHCHFTAEKVTSQKDKRQSEHKFKRKIHKNANRKSKIKQFKRKIGKTQAAFNCI